MIDLVRIIDNQSITELTKTNKTKPEMINPYIHTKEVIIKFEIFVIKISNLRAQLSIISPIICHFISYVDE